MKKFLAIVMALAMMLSCVAFAEETTAADASNTLVVGTPEMNGDFIDGFGSSSYDVWIKEMVHGFCGTYEVTSAGQYVLNNTVVENQEITEDEAGNKTYTFKLYEDLKWSNGSAITAKDYVFALLWKASDEWVTAGASTSVGECLLGYEEYLAGEAAEFPGVALIDDYTFSVTIGAEHLPYYFEFLYATVAPLCMEVWGPELTIASNENGYYLEGDVVAAMNNVTSNERFNPTVGCGPYMFANKFENQTVTLTINPYFKGDMDGNKPTIQYVVQKAIPQDTDHDAVIAGDIDLLIGVIEGNKIEACKAASDKVQMHSYLRNGYGMLTMHTHWSPTADANVRWALAYLVDRSAVCDYVLGGYGGTVDSIYGYAQWMYEYAGDELEEGLTAFNLNIEKANELLDQTEWKYEADGVTPFDPSKANAEGTYMRHNAEGEMLVIHHMGTDENSVTDIIEIQYAANAPLAGLKFEVTRSDFNALLDNYYYSYEMSEDERYYSSFNMGSTFDAAFDPYYSWHSDWVNTWNNACQVNDPELDGYIEAMRTATTDDEYVDAWLQFVWRWQEIMPQIGLYSNEYFDIYNVNVNGVNTTPFWDYSDSICTITKTAG